VNWLVMPCSSSTSNQIKIQPVLRFEKDSPVGKAVFACAHGDNTVALALMLWQPTRD
jgi:hypothetical protein